MLLNFLTLDPRHFVFVLLRAAKSVKGNRYAH